MGNCIDINTWKKGNADISIAGRFKDAMDEARDAQVELLGYIEETAQEILGKAGLGRIRFAMDEDSLFKIQSMCYDTNIADYYLYHAAGADGSKYTLCIEMEPGDTEEELCITSALYREHGTEIEAYNFETSEWETSEEFRKYYSLMRKNGADADLILSLAEQCGQYWKMLDPQSAMDDVAQNKEILALYRRVRWLTDFELVPVAGSLGKRPHAEAMLVPADINRRGSCVYWDGEKKAYCLCRCMTPDDTLEAQITYYMDSYGEEMPCPECFRETVFESSNINEMREALVYLWDHYSGDETQYCFPLSNQAYAQSASPYDGKFRIDTKGKKRELTQEEQGALGETRDFFSI